VSRPTWRSLFLGPPGADFFCGKLGISTKKEKSSKKERNGSLVETDAPKAHHKDHFFERQRFTLKTLFCGPKDGEHFRTTSAIAAKQTGTQTFLCDGSETRRTCNGAHNR
jgi:hypothetical protein